MKSQFEVIVITCTLCICMFSHNEISAQQEGAYLYSDGLISDYQPRIIELDGSRNLMIKYSRFGWDSSWVTMVWLDHAGNIIDHKEHRLSIQLTFLFDVIKVDDGFVMCGVEPGFVDYAFILKTDTAGNLTRLDHFDLIYNENVHSLLARPGNAFTAYSSTPSTYPQNFRIDGSLTDTVYSLSRIDAPVGYYYRMYDIIDDGAGKDIMGGTLIAPNSGGISDNFVMKLGSSSVDWIKTYDFLTYENENVSEIIKLSSGNYFFITQGYPSGATTIDSFIGVLDASGNVVWSKKVSIPLNSVFLSSAVETASGDILVYGNTSYYAGILMRVTDSGNVIWKKTYPNTGGIVVPGKITRNQFNKIAITSYLNGNALLLQLDENGNGCGLQFDTLSVVVPATPAVNNAPLFTITPDTKMITTASFSSRTLNHTFSQLCVGTGMHQAEQTEKFEIFPNPASEILYIELPPSGQHEVIIRIIEPGGKLISSYVGNAGNQLAIPIDKISNGMYFILISDEGNGSLSKRFIVSK